MSCLDQGDGGREVLRRQEEETLERREEGLYPASAGQPGKRDSQGRNEDNSPWMCQVLSLVLLYMHCLCDPHKVPRTQVLSLSRVTNGKTETKSWEGAPDNSFIHSWNKCVLSSDSV